MSAPATRSKSNPENAEVEVDLVGRFAVAWPRLRCGVCGGHAPQLHGEGILRSVEGEVLCPDCWTASLHLSPRAARRLRAAR